jgi:hypothetical protein
MGHRVGETMILVLYETTDDDNDEIFVRSDITDLVSSFTREAAINAVQNHLKEKDIEGEFLIVETVATIHAARVTLLKVTVKDSE